MKKAEVLLFQTSTLNWDVCFKNGGDDEGGGSSGGNNDGGTSDRPTPDRPEEGSKR